MMPAVAILAGGLATRLRPVTQKIPKSLVEVAGRPFLFHQLDLLRRSGIKEVVLCVGHLGEQIQEILPDGSPWNMRIQFSFDGPSLQGTGGALRQALSLLSDPFFVLYGDSYLPIPLEPIHQALPTDKEGLMTVFRNEGRWDTSNVQFEGGILRAYEKKNPLPDFRHIDYGLSLLRKAPFRRFPTGSFDLAELLQVLSREGKLAGHEVKKRFFEIGSPAGLAELRAIFENGSPPES